MNTPQGVSPATFATALKAFAQVVGTDWVFSSAEDLGSYRDAYSPLRGLPDERTASAAVAPASAEEVQAVVRIANQHGIPLYPISTGKNLGYGGSAPARSGDVVLDLKRMNRIIEVNDSNHYCIVEPGVSYFDLYAYIQKKGLKVWIDCPDPGWGSLIGNALDHGVGHTASRYRNHFDAHCGMEVVLANGEAVRTGMGALPKAQTWGQFKMGFGPVLDGLFSQSNFGIVTKMGFWLMPEPEAVMTGWVMAPRYEDLHGIVETLKYVENSGLASGAPEMSSPLLGTGTSMEMVKMFFDGPPKLAARHGELVAGAKLGFSPELQRYGLDQQIPYWQLHMTFYGPPKVIEAQWDAVQSLATKAIKDVRFQAGKIHAGPEMKQAADRFEIYPQNIGMPNLEFFGMGTRAGGNPHPMSGHMWFSPVIPQTAEAIFEVNRVFDEAVRTIPALQRVPVLGLRPFALPTVFIERSFMAILGFPVSDDPKMNQALVQAFRELIRVGAEHGWGEYRTPTIFQDQAASVYSYSNHSLLRLQEAIKDAVDPKGILSPGRYGIWPKQLRKRRAA
jgi:4-cresol dehydrogenase (hydroxylating)